MALKKYQVQEGYAFFHLNRTGQRVKSTPAGGIVELPSIDTYEQSWKLLEVKDEVQPPPNDFALLEGAMGKDGKVNGKLLEFFEDNGIKTFAQVADLTAEKLVEEVKGMKKDQAEKLILSAFQLAGLG